MADRNKDTVMKKLFLIAAFILIASVCSADMLINSYQFSSSGGGSCSSCNSGTDSFIVDPGYTTTSTTSDGSQYQAYKFTIAATTCATGVFIESTDESYGGGCGATGMIYSESGGKPDAMVSGCTGTVSDLSNDVQENEFLFASTVTLPAGTYFVVWYDAGSTCSGYRIGSTGAPANTFYYSTDGSTWSSSSYYRNMGVIGCTPD